MGAEKHGTRPLTAHQIWLGRRGKGSGKYKKTDVLKGASVFFEYFLW